MGTRANFVPERECKKRRMGRSLVEFRSPLAKIPSRAKPAKPARELAAAPQKVSRSHPLSPATQATILAVSKMNKKKLCFI